MNISRVYCCRYQYRPNMAKNSDLTEPLLKFAGHRRGQRLLQEESPVCYRADGEDPSHWYREVKGP